MSLERILVVDDEPLVRRSLEDILRARKLQVVGVGTLAAAEELLGKDTFDLVLLDVRLPGQSGLDLQDALAVVERYAAAVCA